MGSTHIPGAASPKPEHVEYHYNIASDCALKHVEDLARGLMRERPELHEFVMGMGIWSFGGPDGDSYHNDDIEDIDELEDFIAEWDEVFHLTGEPMRFTAEGEKRTEWGPGGKDK